MDKILARKTWTKDIDGAEYGSKKPVRLEVDAKLYVLGSNEYPYYSLTGSVKSYDKRLRDPYLAGGCIHETILKHFPELAPLATVHLSEADGRPMHAEANARFWAGLSKYTPTGNNPSENPTETDEAGTFNPSLLASHLQCDDKTARELRKGLLMGLPWDRVIQDLGLVDLWSSQAGQARALLNEMAVSA
jgi:hypothetical protein